MLTHTHTHTHIRTHSWKGTITNIKTSQQIRRKDKGEGGGNGKGNGDGNGNGNGEQVEEKWLWDDTQMWSGQGEYSFGVGSEGDIGAARASAAIRRFALRRHAVAGPVQRKHPLRERALPIPFPSTWNNQSALFDHPSTTNHRLNQSNP